MLFYFFWMCIFWLFAFVKNTLTIVSLKPVQGAKHQEEGKCVESFYQRKWLQADQARIRWTTERNCRRTFSRTFGTNPESEWEDRDIVVLNWTRLA